MGTPSGLGERLAEMSVELSDLQQERQECAEVLHATVAEYEAEAARHAEQVAPTLILTLALTLALTPAVTLTPTLTPSPSPSPTPSPAPPPTLHLRRSPCSVRC